MKRTILVAGPRSSGTRLMTRILVESGCFGDFTHNQRMDAFDIGFPTLNSEMPPYDMAELMEESKPYDFAVIRRSYPHGAGFADVVALRESLTKHGFYLDTALWMFRNPDANAKSMLNQGHVATIEDARASVKEALNHLPSILISEVALYAVEFANLIQPPYVKRLLERADIALTPKSDFVFDADSKHLQ